MTNQSHSGSGDNVAGNKKTNNYIALNSIWIAVVIIVLGLAAWLVPKLLPEAVPLTGYVISNAEIPMDKAKVVVVVEGEESVTGYTDENGFFRIEKVDIKKVSSFEIKAQYNERNVEESFSEITPESLPISIQMPAGIPPFKVSYTYMEGFAIDFFLENNLEEKVWGSLFTGGRNYILSGAATYQALLDLRNKYGREITIYEGSNNGWVSDISEDGQLIFDQAIPGKKERYEDLEDLWFYLPMSELSTILDMGEWVDPNLESNPELIQYMENIIGYDMDRVMSLPADEQAEINRLRNMLDEQNVPTYGDDWNYDIGYINFEKAIKDNPDDFFQLLESQRTQFGPDANKQLGFFRAITNDFLPEDFLRFRFIQVCGPNPRIVLNVPDLKVKFAIIENISANPINLDSFYIHENEVDRLRTLENDLEVLQNSQPTAKKLFPNHTLGAQEKLIIPLAMEFAFREKLRFDETKDDVYVYGPSLEIDEILVGIEKYPFREMDPEVFALMDGWSIMASCPFVYTKKVDDGPWLLEDHILYMKHRESLQGFDTLNLNQFTGELQLRETDPETSYIDLVEILFQPVEGPAIRLQPDLESLATKDGCHLIMNQGDERVLTFDGYDPTAAGIYSVVSYGWYEPYDDY